MKSYTDLGNALSAANRAYAAAENKLTPGGQSILTTASQLIHIGAKDSKKNPIQPFLDVDEMEEIEGKGELSERNEAMADGDSDGRQVE